MGIYPACHVFTYLSVSAYSYACYFRSKYKKVNSSFRAKKSLYGIIIFLRAINHKMKKEILIQRIFIFSFHKEFQFLSLIIVFLHTSNIYCNYLILDLAT